MRRKVMEQPLGKESKLYLSWSFVKIYWKILFAVSWALLLAPMIIVNNTTKDRLTTFIGAFGILSTADVCSCYMNDTIMVFLGGLILAIATEHSNLHLRIALSVMKTVGCTHAKLLGGLCGVTTFISMWVSNTAATAMMVPIIFAILKELEQAGLSRVFDEFPPETNSPDAEPVKKPTNVTKAYLTAAAYCSTFGGTGTIVGTGTNLTFKGIFESTFPESEGINFTDWMIASTPQMVVNSFLTWIYLRIAFMGYLRPNSKDAQMASIGEEGQTITNRVIQERYQELGDIRFHEAAVAILFLFCILLWIFRKPGFVLGWSELLTEISLRDSVPVMFVSILMFFIPKDLKFLHSFSDDPEARPTKSSEGLITWDVIQKKMPWSLMFLLGGGFAISKGSVASGLARQVGEALMPLRHLPPFLILVIVSFFVGTITEFTSNVGIANITQPVIAQMCVAMNIHPMYLMYPAAIMCSYSFRLPVGTPPNAIITVAGNIPTKWLMLGGCGPSVYALVVQTTFFIIWSSHIWRIKEFPEWAKLSSNVSTTT